MIPPANIPKALSFFSPSPQLTLIHTHTHPGNNSFQGCYPAPARLTDDPNYDTRPQPASHKATWPRIELPLHFPAEKLKSPPSVNRLSLVRRQLPCRPVMDGTAVSPVINTAPLLNKADSFVPITFEPLKPSVNCICLRAEVYSRLFAKSGLICRDNSNILQAPGRQEGLPCMASQGSPQLQPTRRPTRQQL